MSTTTSNLGLYKPAIDEVGWGASVNTNWDKLDASITTNAIPNYLGNKSFGTVTITAGSITNLTVSNLSGYTYTLPNYLGNFTAGTVNITIASITSLTTTNLTTTSIVITNAISSLTVSSLTGDANKAVKRIVELVTYDSTTAVAAVSGGSYLFIPTDFNGFNLVNADACVNLTSSSGQISIRLFNINNNVNMLTTKIYIDSLKNTSYASSTASVIGNGTQASVTTGDQIRVDIDGVGTGTQGLATILVFGKP